MSTPVLIIGESGSGKTTALRNLNPEETFILQIIRKALPFRGWKAHYIPYKKETNENNEVVRSGNLFVHDKVEYVEAMLDVISNNMPHIKTIVIDDFQYFMANKMMEQATVKGYEKFTMIASEAYRVLNKSKNLRDDLDVFFLAHSDTVDGKVKMKTAGKMLDEKYTPEGIFTIVLMSCVVDGQYKFLVHNTAGNTTVKTPMGMFDGDYIDNDLALVKRTMKEFENE